MQISLSKCFIEELILNKISTSEKHSEKKFSLDYYVSYFETEPKLFSVVFDVSVLHPQQYELKAKYVANFRTDDNIDAQFKQSSFPIVNAPAIAFPFLRALISTLTINAGLEPIILPSINFINFNKSKSEGKTQYKML